MVLYYSECSIYQLLSSGFEVGDWMFELDCSLQPIPGPGETTFDVDACIIVDDEHFHNLEFRYDRLESRSTEKKKRGVFNFLIYCNFYSESFS